jgi:hypothetical protein
MPAAGETPPPLDAIADPVTPGATCTDWYMQDLYAGTWDTDMTWWEFRCTAEDVQYYNACTTIACDAYCPWCWTDTRDWTDRFFWNGSAPSFYGETFEDFFMYNSGLGSTTVAWWDAPNLQWYDLNRYTLTVVKQGAGLGTVASSPAGIACGDTCEMFVEAGGMVTLTATADASSVFTGWSGASECTGTGPCELSIGNGRSVTATFVRKSFDVTVSKAGTGSGRVISSPAGIDCGPVCVATYASGTALTLTAVPSSDSTFIGWTGDCAGTGSCQVTVNGARAVTAAFAPIVHRPDALIRIGTGSPWTGDNVYDVTGTGQSISVTAARGSALMFEIEAQNDGTVTDAFALAGSAGVKGISVTYADTTIDLTALVVQGAYQTEAVAPGATRMLSMTVTIANGARAGTRLTIPVSVSSGGIVDRVLAVVTVASR